MEASQLESYSFSLPTAPQLAMAQEQLRDVWLHAQHGRHSAWEQAKALALREASRELHGRTLRRPGCGLREVRATVQRSQQSLVGPERLGTMRASAPPRAGPSVAAAPPKRNAWSHPGTIPEPSEAVGESRSMTVSLLTSFKRNARSHPGTIPEP